MTKFEFQTGDKVLARYDDESEWEFHHFSHKEGDEFSCDGWTCQQCIPYNETTKHLCGTSDPYVDPTDFEVGDTVRFQYTSRTTGCGEIVGITGDTIQVSVSGGVYSIDRKRLALVRRGEKKVDAPIEAPAFEFGDVVEGKDEGGELFKGIFSHSQSNGYWGEALAKGGIATRTFCMETARLIRKGNFHD